jgi:hypothetical protein
MYDLHYLREDYGEIRGYVKPKDRFRGSIMNLVSLLSLSILLARLIRRINIFLLNIVVSLTLVEGVVGVTRSRS